jgi:O-antigen/teichoic acid export membrane protein
MVARHAAHAAGYAVMLTRAAHAAGVEVDWSGWRREARVLWKFSLPALLAVAVASQVNWLCRVIIVNQPDGYPQMGLFNAANQWRTAILFLPSTIAHSFLPVLSNLVGNRDARNYRRILWSSMALNGCLALAAAAVIAVSGKLIMAGYGHDFASGRATLILLAGAAVLAATIGTVGQAITSAGFMWWGFLLNATWAATLIPAVWWLRARGAWGFAMANLIAYGLHVVLCIYFFYQTSAWLFGKEDRSAEATRS